MCLIFNNLSYLSYYANALVWMCHYAKGQLLFIMCLTEQEASHNSDTIAIIHLPRLLKRHPPASLSHTKHTHTIVHHGPCAA